MLLGDGVEWRFLGRPAGAGLIDGGGVIFF
jgi:hypothetical protein